MNEVEIAQRGTLIPVAMPRTANSEIVLPDVVSGTKEDSEVNVRRGGLGRGLGALIPAGPMEADAPIGARFEEVSVDSVEPNPRQPREIFDEEALAELVTSIREVGVLQPVVVRELSPGRYQLVMGERRLRACREAGLTTVPAIIRDTEDDALLRDALLENLHRQQLNPLEEAAAYQQLLAEFGATHDELADRIGRSRSQVSNTIRLLGFAAYRATSRWCWCVERWTCSGPARLGRS